MRPSVSVIVPIYNIEKYLLGCLESIAAQTLDHIQVLLIDDGSQDRSGEICKEFIKTHPNFEYYYKENGGTASARNVGLEHATGEYIGFVDSDDWIEADMYEKMYDAARDNHADILYCIMPGLTDYVLLDSGSYEKEEIISYIYPQILPHVISTGTFRTVDWGNCSRLYRGDIIRDHGIRFYEKSRRCEDFAFAVECTLYANRYTVIDEGELYHYRPNENSKSRSYTKNMWKSIRALMKYMIKMTNNYEEYDFTQAMQTCVFYFCTSVIRNELRANPKKMQIKKINQVIQDPVCRKALEVTTPKGMNKEYQNLYRLMQKGNGAHLRRYLINLSYRKKYLAPILSSLVKNKWIKKIYTKIRRA